MHSAQGADGGEHERAAQAVSLIAGEDADLRNVAHAGGDFGRQHGSDDLVCDRIAQHERSRRYELAASGKQNDVLQKLERATARAVLVVDLAVDVIGISQINQFGARLEIAVVPALKTERGREPGGLLPRGIELQEHELALVQPETLLTERFFDGSSEGHELSLDASDVRKRAKRKEHLVEQLAADGLLRMARGDVQAADQTLLIFENVEGIADRLAVFQGDSAGEGVGVEKALDELDGAAIVPVEFVAPVAGRLLPATGAP